MKRSFLAAHVAAAIACFALSNSQSALAFSAPHPVSIAQLAKRVAVRTDTVGRCYAAVKGALRPLGVELTGGAAWMAQSQLLNDKRFQVVSPKALKAGDILVHGKSSSHPYGHIAVYLGNNMEASDHVQGLITGGSYGRTIAFRARGKSAARQVRIARSLKQSSRQLVLAHRQPSKQEALAHAVAVANNRIGSAEALDHAVSVAKPVLKDSMLAALIGRPLPKSYLSEVAALPHPRMSNPISVQDVEINDGLAGR